MNNDELMSPWLVLSIAGAALFVAGVIFGRMAYGAMLFTVGVAAGVIFVELVLKC